MANFGPIKPIDAELRQMLDKTSQMLDTAAPPDTWVSPLGRALADAKRHVRALEERVEILEAAMHVIRATHKGTCEHCKAEFWKSRHDSRYCAKVECHRAHNRERQKKFRTDHQPVRVTLTHHRDHF